MLTESYFQDAGHTWSDSELFIVPRWRGKRFDYSETAKGGGLALLGYFFQSNLSGI